MDGAFGLSADLVSVYEVAIGQVVWKRDDLVDAVVRRVGLSVHDAPLAVERLLEEGLLAVAESRSDSVRVVSPGVGFGDRLTRARQDVASRQDRLNAGTAWMEELQARHELAQEHHRSQIMERIVGIDALRARLEELAVNTREELLSLVPAPALTPEAIQHSQQLDEQTLNRGVQVRTVVMDSAVRHPGNAAYLRWLVDLGAGVRTVSELPLRLVISDRRIAIIPIEPSSPREGALIVRAPGLITSLLVLFDTTWRSGHDFGSHRSPLPGAETESTRGGFDESSAAVLRILATGATDDTVAKRLGMSVRSVRRNMARVMADLDVSSRFELGIRLGATGWDPEAEPTCRDRD